MAQHDFAPAWLNFPTPPSSTKSSLNLEKHPENFARPENRYDVNRRRHNSSDGFDSGIGRPGRGNFGRKEKIGWRTQGRNVAENVNQRGGYHGGNNRPRSGTFHGGKSQVLHENNLPDGENGKKEEREQPKQFEAEDFPSLNPQSEKEPSQSKSVATGVWEHPLNPKSRTPKMLVIKKANKEDSAVSGFQAVGSPHSQPVKNGTGPSVYKGLVPKPAGPATKSNRSNSSSPVDKLSQPRVMKLTRMCTDKKSEFLKALKQDKIEEGHKERDVNRNFDENKVPRENGNALMISKQIIHSSTFPQMDILSSSLEAEHRLLKEMGWQEDSENDETCAPITEDEMREFQVISEQLQKNGFRKNGPLKNGLTCDFKFAPWKNSTFKSTVDSDDTETSSSDTSDDDDV
ncbi:vasculin isoform X2 [Latimeria chalumnae]|uniref:vasculin isoform X2 n=1 Tax=Latimeria chalumnae TaxID=7897 RepID=UPI0006D8EB72|nr:PREDICTED: vasculin isoform X2 [Latimeria chalumnae]|eukprot:XP_014351099.1 PREDICTED: vasculin isoform X2 [Latimeria chalumnae]